VFIGHLLVKKTLQQALGTERGVDSLPLGVTRNTGNSEFVPWTSTDAIFDKYSGTLAQDFSDAVSTGLDTYRSTHLDELESIGYPGLKRSITVSFKLFILADEPDLPGMKQTRNHAQGPVREKTSLFQSPSLIDQSTLT